jgi:hypothetical protein
MYKPLLIISLLSFTIFADSCVSEVVKDEAETVHDLPKKLQNIPIGIEVMHTLDTVYATINTKDPEKRGIYQLQFSTSVSSINQTLVVTEFSAFILKDGKWVMRTIYDRAFNNEEFEKWYDCPDGVLQLDQTYTDEDNWLAKGNKLNGMTLNAIIYVKAVDSDGIEFIGYKRIVGILELDKNVQVLTIDSTTEISDDSFSSYLSIDQAIDTIWNSNKVQALNEFIKMNSADKDKCLITVRKEANSKHVFTIAVVEDTPVASVTHYNFNVNLESGVLLFNDTFTDEEIDFEEWKIQ